jgi:hypothetical protein
VTVAKDGKLRLEQVPLAPLRWEHIDVSIDGLELAEDVPDRILDEAANYVRLLGETDSAPRALGLRVRLTGASSQYAEIRRLMAGSDWRSLRRVVDDTAVFVNKIFDAMELPLDLVRIAAGDDPAALMAQRVLILQQNGNGSRTLLEKARAQLRKVAQEDLWSPLQDHRHASDPLADNALREMLIRAGKAALNAMLSGSDPA